MEELPIIQKTYDLIKWYVPILNRLPKDHKFMLGDRMIARLYDILETLILARYSAEKLSYDVFSVPVFPAILFRISNAARSHTPSSPNACFIC